LEDLVRWCEADVEEYYQRIEDCRNKSSDWWHHFEAFAKARDDEYKERELKAFDEYAKRMGWKGCMDPVRREDWNSTEQVLNEGT